MRQLIIGGARSGKSSLAESLAQKTNKTVIYFATANAQHNDAEMARRIEDHRQNRPQTWQTVECTIDLPERLAQYSTKNHCLIVDCLTLWLSNCLLAPLVAGDGESDTVNMPVWRQQRRALLEAVANLSCDLIFVGNEVGNGIVPMGEINRCFVDENGRLHQDLGAICDRVIFTMAGLPLVLKGEPL